jgi:SAM-dependent methyltransferase
MNQGHTQSAGKPDKEAITELLEIGRSLNFWDRGYDFPRRSQQFFGEVDIRGKNVLEIGCGAGLFCIWAGLNGAAKVVGLEPLEKGSGSFDQTRVYKEFNTMAKSLSLNNVEISPELIQVYETPDETFDVVLSYASVNHLDEESCEHLRESEEAREAYRNIFRSIAKKMKPGGKFILADSAKRNFFGDIGITNPMEPSIEWFKHESPEYWGELLLQSGFSNPKISWPSGRILRYLRIYKRPGVVSYFVDSAFRLEVTRE